MHHVQFILIVIIWGSSFLLMKVASVLFGPLAIGGGRTLGGAVTLGVIMLAMRSGPGLTRRDLAMLLPLIFLGYVWPFTVQPYVIGTSGESAFFGMMVALVPLMTMLVQIPLLGIRPTLRQLIGIIGGLGCFTLLAREGIDKLDLPMWKILLAMTVPLAYALSNTLVKRWFESHSPLGVTFAALTGATMVLLPISAAVEPLRETGAIGVSYALGSMVLLGVFGSGLAIFMFYRLIRSHGPLFAGMVTYLVPLLALMWGWVDAERITLLQLMALCGILAMVFLVQFRAKPAMRT